ncbi:hypothetical protein LINPERPRIM_LOCUS38437 [Linum perenne]
MGRVSRDEVLKHRLRLMETISVLQTLAVHDSSFGGHDESGSSQNRGNLIEWLEHLAEWREDVKSVVLKNALAMLNILLPSYIKSYCQSWKIECVVQQGRKLEMQVFLFLLMKPKMLQDESRWLSY